MTKPLNNLDKFDTLPPRLAHLPKTNTPSDTLFDTPKAMKRVILKGSTYWYRRKRPRAVEHVEPRREILHSLKTDSAEEAARKARELDREYDAYWALLEDRQNEEARERHERIKRICRARGFNYKTTEELAEQATVEELLARIAVLEAATPRHADPAPEMVAALLGTSTDPAMPLSEMMRIYFESSGDKQKPKSPEQLRRWKNARIKAMGYMTEALGDKNVADLTRDDMLAWREALWARVSEGGFTADTANKQMSYVTAMLRHVEKLHRIALPDIRNLMFEAGQGGTRTPFETDFIQKSILAPGALEGMNPELRRVLLGMIETGMSISESVNIAPENIVLDAAIPHLRIRPTEGRELKTKVRLRDIPLVGVSLMAYQAQPDGFPRYRDREAAASAAINKFLREHDLRPTSKHSAYSLRHAFEDRMLAAGADDRMRSELMGHAYKREKYGQGPSLQMKLDLLNAMALKPPASV